MLIESRHCIRISFPTIDFHAESNNKEEQRTCSAHQLIVDLGESITRCEKVETYITTNLFLFLILYRVAFFISADLKQIVTESYRLFFRAYIASVLVIEGHSDD